MNDVFGERVRNKSTEKKIRDPAGRQDVAMDPWQRSGSKLHLVFRSSAKVQVA